MRFPFSAIHATLIRRPNRFVIHAHLAGGAEVRAHCPNPGRMHELMIPGATVYLSHHPEPRRRTAYTLRFVEHPQNGQLISLDTQLPNHLFAEALAEGQIPIFYDYTKTEKEVSLPAHVDSPVRSRIDFRLGAPHRPPCWVEVKSVSLVEAGVALFPDAPTTRGRRHLEDLVRVVEQGEQAAVFFIVQRPDAHLLRPHWETDPDFSLALAAASAAGVALHACTSRVSLTEMTLAGAIPVQLAADG